VTRLLLWEEYRAANPDGSGYTWLCTTCEAWKQRARPSIRLTHMVGDGVRRFRWRYSQILNRGRRSVRQAKGILASSAARTNRLASPIEWRSTTRMSL